MRIKCIRKKKLQKIYYRKWYVLPDDSNEWILAAFSVG